MILLKIKKRKLVEISVRLVMPDVTVMDAYDLFDIKRLPGSLMQ